MLEYLNTVYNQLYIYFVPVLLSFLAGLATVIGGFITFIVKKDNIKMLSLGLGFSAGVMIFLSLTEIKSCAEEYRLNASKHGSAEINLTRKDLEEFLGGIIYEARVYFETI